MYEVGPPPALIIACMTFGWISIAFRMASWLRFSHVFPCHWWSPHLFSLRAFASEMWNTGRPHCFSTCCWHFGPKPCSLVNSLESPLDPRCPCRWIQEWACDHQRPLHRARSLCQTSEKRPGWLCCGLCDHCQPPPFPPRHLVVVDPFRFRPRTPTHLHSHSSARVCTRAWWLVRTSFSSVYQHDFGPKCQQHVEKQWGRLVFHISEVKDIQPRCLSECDWHSTKGHASDNQCGRRTNRIHE